MKLTKKELEQLSQLYNTCIVGSNWFDDYEDHREQNKIATSILKKINKLLNNS